MLPFWITIEKKRTATPLNLGVGITAISETDARNIFVAAFGNEYQIASVSVVDDVGALDQNHVIPNMGSIFRRGVWFPIGYEHIRTETLS